MKINYPKILFDIRDIASLLNGLTLLTYDLLKILFYCRYHTMFTRNSRGNRILQLCIQSAGIEVDSDNPDPGESTDISTCMIQSNHLNNGTLFSKLSNKEKKAPNFSQATTELVPNENGSNIDSYVEEVTVLAGNHQDEYHLEIENKEDSDIEIFLSILDQSTSHRKKKIQKLKVKVTRQMNLPLVAVKTLTDNALTKRTLTTYLLIQILMVEKGIKEKVKAKVIPSYGKEVSKPN